MFFFGGSARQATATGSTQVRKEKSVFLQGTGVNIAASWCPLRTAIRLLRQTEADPNSLDGEANKTLSLP